MSRSTLYLVYDNTSEILHEYRNGWGTGPAIWDTIGKLGGISFDSDDLWKLARNPTMPLHLRMCHAFTFDRAVCPAGRLNEMAEWLVMAHADMDQKRVSHFGTIAEHLREIAKQNNPELRGVALNCTSVSVVWTSKMSIKDGWDCVEYVIGNNND